MTEEPIGTPEQLQIALDASIETNQRLVAGLARADALARAAERLLLARKLGGDLAGPCSSLEAALSAWSAEGGNAARSWDLANELEQASGTVEALAALLRLLLDRILLNGSGKELKSFAEKIEAELSEVLRPQRGN
mgnify:CR=1 FL=1